jgi:hypothetical protein
MLVAGPIVVIISRDEVEMLDTSSVMKTLRSCLESTECALSYFERLDVAFDGYNNDPRELFEIPEVREYVSILDSQFPYWLFFLTKKGLGLQCIMLCFMPPNLANEAHGTVLPHRLDDLLSRRWFPAMDQVCQSVGFSEQQIEDLTDRVVNYFIDGPLNRPLLS